MAWCSSWLVGWLPISTVVQIDSNSMECEKFKLIQGTKNFTIKIQFSLNSNNNNNNIKKTLFIGPSKRRNQREFEYWNEEKKCRVIVSIIFHRCIRSHVAFAYKNIRIYRNIYRDSSHCFIETEQHCASERLFMCTHWRKTKSTHTRNNK